MREVSEGRRWRGWERRGREMETVVKPRAPYSPSNPKKEGHFIMMSSGSTPISFNSSIIDPIPGLIETLEGRKRYNGNN